MRISDWSSDVCSSDLGEEGARLLGVSFDITERKHAEAAIQESEWRFRTIFEQANDYIFTADLEQRVTSCNPAVCAALGYTEEEALGKSFAHFVGADGFEQTTAMLNRKVQRGGSTRHTIAVNSKDRKSTRLNPVTNAHLVCRLLLDKKKKHKNTKNTPAT